MMTKWDTIQADLEPVIPRYWNDEQEIETVSLDELLEETENLTDEQLEALEKNLTLGWEE